MSASLILTDKFFFDKDEEYNLCVSPNKSLNDNDKHRNDHNNGKRDFISISQVTSYIIVVSVNFDCIF